LREKVEWIAVELVKKWGFRGVWGIFCGEDVFEKGEISVFSEAIAK
jgi:hypothetical protein